MTEQSTASRKARRRAKQTRSRAKSRSRRRSKARSTSTEEQRTKQHDIIEARQRSKAHTARRRSKALRRLSLAARRHRRLHCKALAHTYVCFFFPVLPPVLLLVQATRRRPGYAHAGLLMRPDLAVMPPKKRKPAAQQANVTATTTTPTAMSDLGTTATVTGRFDPDYTPVRRTRLAMGVGDRG